MSELNRSPVWRRWSDVMAERLEKINDRRTERGEAPLGPDDVSVTIAPQETPTWVVSVRDREDGEVTDVTIFHARTDADARREALFSMCTFGSTEADFEILKVEQVED